MKINYKQIKRINWNYKDIAYGSDPLQKLDMVCNSNNIHGIVYIHGGAYFAGNKQHYPSFLSDYADNNLIASVNYRVVTSENNICMKDIISDIDSALTKITEISLNRGVKIKDFVLIGHSAGGQIVLLYANKYNKRFKISSCVGLAAPTDFTDDIGWSAMTEWGNTIEERLNFLSTLGSRLSGCTIQLTQYNWTKQENYHEYKNAIQEMSPVFYVTENSPPTILVHAELDKQVPCSNAHILKQKLFENSVLHKLVSPEEDSNSHMLGGVLYSETSPFTFDNSILWVKELKKWIDQVLANTFNK